MTGIYFRKSKLNPHDGFFCVKENQNLECLFGWLADPFPVNQQFIISAPYFASALEFQSRSMVYEKRRV